jgi:hypothetical protein
MYNVRYKTNGSFLLARYNRVNLAGTSGLLRSTLAPDGKYTGNMLTNKESSGAIIMQSP